MMQDVVDFNTREDLILIFNNLIRAIDDLKRINMVLVEKNNSLIQLMLAANARKGYAIRQKKKWKKSREKTWRKNENFQNFQNSKIIVPDELNEQNLNIELNEPPVNITQEPLIETDVHVMETQIIETDVPVTETQKVPYNVENTCESSLTPPNDSSLASTTKYPPCHVVFFIPKHLDLKVVEEEIFLTLYDYSEFELNLTFKRGSHNKKKDIVTIYLERYNSFYHIVLFASIVGFDYKIIQEKDIQSNKRKKRNRGHINDDLSTSVKY